MAIFHYMCHKYSQPSGSLDFYLSFLATQKCLISVQLKCLVFSFTHIKYLIYMPFLANLVCQRLPGILKAIKLSFSWKASHRSTPMGNRLIYFSWFCFSLFSFNSLYVSNLASLLALLLGKKKFIWKVKIDQKIQSIYFALSP